MRIKLPVTILGILFFPLTTFCQCVEVADYEFSGNTNDASSYSITATNYGATLAADRFGNANSAYSFNGSSYIQADTNNRGVVNGVTISAWAKTTVGGMLVEKYDWQEDEGYFIQIYQGQALIAGRDSSGTYYSCSSQFLNLQDGQWHLITGVYRGTQWEIWVDGVQANTQATGHTTGILKNTQPLTIGYNSNASATSTEYYYTGEIDEVKLWPCALNPAAIAGMYSKSPVSCTNVADYEFSGNTNDASSYSITATNYGATLAADRFGNTNDAYSFDGSSYIQADTNNRGVVNEVTVLAWAKTTVGGMLVEKYDWQEDEGYFIQIYQGQALIAGRDSSGTYYSCSSQSLNLQDGQWHLITGVYRGTQWEIWVDGTLANTQTTGHSTGILKNTQPLTIGYNSNASASYTEYYYTGEIDEVKIWPCALDSATIASMYSNPNATGVASVIASQSQITVYPSPTSDILNISGNTQGIAGVSITDLAGKSVLDGTYNSQISVNKLNAGIYVILLKGVDGNVMESLKFVKE